MRQKFDTTASQKKGGLMRLTHTPNPLPIESKETLIFMGGGTHHRVTRQLVCLRVPQKQPSFWCSRVELFSKKT